MDEKLNRNSAVATDQRERGAGGESPPLKCFLAYEDLLTGLRAKRVLDRVLTSAGDLVTPQLQLLRFDLLGNPELHYWAAREAGQSDLVVLSSHGQSALPEVVKSWLDLWLCRRSGEPAALVASLDEKVEPVAEQSPAIAYLRRLAAQSGFTLFTHFGSMSCDAVRSTLRCIQRRLSQQARADNAPFLEPRGTWPSWGINE